jgi:hypothetical protein
MFKIDQRGIPIGSVASIVSSSQFNYRFFERSNQIYELAAWRFNGLMPNGSGDCEQ